MTSPKSAGTKFTATKTSFVWPLVGILLALTLIGFYEPGTSKYSVFKRDWGFDHIAFYGITGVAVIVALCLVLVIPYTNTLLQKGLHQFSKILSGLGRKKIILFLLGSAASYLLFYFLRIKYNFLGDLNLRMNQTMQREFLATEYLTMRALYVFASTGKKFGYAVEPLFKLYSYLAGTVFVFFSFLIADLTGKTVFQKILLFVTQLASAVLLVFCGYIEIYATPILFLSVYFYCGLRYLKTGSGFLLALLSILFAIGCHVLCLAALPSLAVCWYFRNKHRVPFISRMSNKKIALWISALVLISLFVALRMKSGFLHVLSAPPSKPNLMTLFSLSHLWELFNGLVLCCGLSFLFIFILLVRCIREKKHLLSEHYFLLSISGCFFLLVFMANLQRGSGDWDIVAFTAVSLNLVTSLLIIHVFSNQSSIAQYLLIAITGLNSIHTFLWLQINHTDRSIKKTETMLVGDPGTYYTSRISGAMQLALAYKNNKLFKESLRAAFHACDVSNDMKACVMYGIGLRDAGRAEESIVFFEDMLAHRSPFAYEPYLFILEHYEKKRDYVKFDYYLNLLFDSFIQNPDVFTTTINFKPEGMQRIFTALYNRSPKASTARLQQIQSVIEYVKTLKPGGSK